MVQQRVVQSCDQMRCARAGGRDAHAKLSRKLGVSGGHKGGHFLMPGLNELDFSVRPIEGAEYPIDAVAGVPENTPHAPVVKTLDKEIAYGLGYRKLAAR
jgi:hypothetical protein